MHITVQLAPLFIHDYSIVTDTLEVPLLQKQHIYTILQFSRAYPSSNFDDYNDCTA